MVSDAVNGLEHPCGVHDWADERGNRGSEICSQHTVETHTVWTECLFEPTWAKNNVRLTEYFNQNNSAERRLFVVINSQLLESKRALVEAYFTWCKAMKHLQDFAIMPISVGPDDKKMDKVLELVKSAKMFGLKRRDMFIALGDTGVTEVVGFAAAIYRRSTPWILIPTDFLTVIHYAASGMKVSLDFVDHDKRVHRSALTLTHFPIASFFDASFLEVLSEGDLRKCIEELIRTPKDEFFHSCLAAANVGNFAVSVREEVARAIDGCKAASQEGTGSTTTKLALRSVLSLVQRHSSSTVPSGSLKAFEAAAVTRRPQSVESCQLCEAASDAAGNGAESWELALPGKARLNQDVRAEILSSNGHSEDVSEVLECSLKTLRKMKTAAPSKKTALIVNDPRNSVSKHSITQKVRYHIATMPALFSVQTDTLVRDYCAQNANGHRKKILAIVDDRIGSFVDVIKNHLEGKASAMGDLRVIAVSVSHKRKDMASVLEIVDTAIRMSISTDDLLLAVGGGTLMDTVGFAAAVLGGGVPYIRIPTTLVGMIDAGVGIKVGVDVDLFKSLIGRYYAPVACLNDPETFLATLPRREFACGLAESVKLAIVKSPRLFELIEQFHRDGKCNADTHELIQVAIRTMLEELQPNLHERDLRRLVDFGHEFGHIVETAANYNIPHGECVAIGMSISCFLAHLKGILLIADLERILNCILDLGLPICLAEHDCCDPHILWKKISTDGIQQKDGKLLLVVPKSIGQGTFLDDIADISAELVNAAVLGLKKYSDGHKTESSPTEVELAQVSHPNGAIISTIEGDSVRKLTSTMSQDTRNGVLSSTSTFSVSPETTPPPAVAIIGASGDIGSQLAIYLAQNHVRVTCLVRPDALDPFKQRIQHIKPAIRVIACDFIDLATLRMIIQENGVLYNMAGVVTLSAKPDKYATMVAVNGFAQGIITSLIQKMGKDQHVQVVFPSSQRVHLTTQNASVDAWIQNAALEFDAHQEALLSQPDTYQGLEQFTEAYLASRPLPAGLNVYELSKRLGEHFVSLLPRHVCMRISGVYGPTFKRGFIYRATNPNPDGNTETSEVRDFIYIDDLNEVLWRSTQVLSAGGHTFDGASGESLNLKEIWTMARALIGDDATVKFTNAKSQDSLSLDTSFARHLLGRDFVPMRLGLRKTIDVLGYPPRQSKPITVSQHPKPFETAGSGKHTLDPALRDELLRSCHNPHVIVVDVGATYLRVGVMDSESYLLDEPTRVLSPSILSYPEDTISELQARLLEMIVHQVNAVKIRHPRVSFEEVAISFGGVVTYSGIVEDASVLWGQQARGYDLKDALLSKLPGTQVTILNDVSAAAWRYKDDKRFCLITISSGLSNKIFNSDLQALDQLELDAAGIGGEMGHVVVEPRAVDALVRHAVAEAIAHPTEFRSSQLYTYSQGNARDISARHLSLSAKNRDLFAMRLLEEADVPQCACGNLGDLCSYSSGRGVLRWAQRLAARGDYDVEPTDITDNWLRQGIADGHPLARDVLDKSTYPLALRILQLAADVGLDKFIIVGGFALKTGGSACLEALQDHLTRLCHYSAFYSAWDEQRLRGLVRLGIADDNDSLIGMGYFVQHQRMHYSAIEKEVGLPAQAVIARSIPRCGGREILTKVVYSGICTTDLQILRGERQLEPTIMGHEGVCEVLEVGREVRGVTIGEMIVLNPNNPLDDHDKLGHTKEGLFQEYFKFGQESIDREQVISLGRSVVSAADTLIEPLSCVVAAQERIRDRIAGKNVLVIGAGVMGLMFVLMNSKMGARNVFLANRSKERLTFAISRGIIQESKTFVISKPIASHLDDVAAGKGADIIIICVSLGQGLSATQDAINCVNSAGIVYLFAGFRPSDTLTLGTSTKVELWPLRTGWQTQRVEVAGKIVELSGHRGSRKQDLKTAADVIREDRLSFNKLVSHHISLDAVPDVMTGLACDGRLQGVQAGRVIVDMAARGRLIECAEQLPYRHLREAAAKQRDEISMGNLFREIGFEGNTSRLGWVHPPSWQDIENTITMALRMQPLTSKTNFIWVATGSWGFQVSALNQIVPTALRFRSHVLQSLDPRALSNVFEQIEDLSDTVCLGTSQSGATMETVLLMNALRERFDHAGLDCQKHFMWLTNMCESPDDLECGEAIIRSSKEYDWSSVCMLPVTINNRGDVNALFCTPHSTLFYMSLTLLLGSDLEAMRQLYQQYLTLQDKAVYSVLSQAHFVALNNVEHIFVRLDESIASFMADLITQLIEQGLGSKQANFNPKVLVSSGDQVAGFKPLEISMPNDCPTVVKMMLTMSALSVYAAAVGYHKRMDFVTHPSVGLYKNRTKELLVVDEIHQETSKPQTIRTDLLTYLRCNSQIHFVEFIYFGYLSVEYRQAARAWLMDCLQSMTHVSPNIVLGEQWNHSRYQAAVQRVDTLHVVLVSQDYYSRVHGILEETIDRNIRTLKAIARATYETLLPRALMFQVDEAFPTEQMPGAAEQ